MQCAGYGEIHEFANNFFSEKYMCSDSVLDKYTKGRLLIGSSIMKADFGVVLSIALMTGCVSFKLSLNIKHFVKRCPCQHKNSQVVGTRNIPKEAGKITGNMTNVCNNK